MFNSVEVFKDKIIYFVSDSDLDGISARVVFRYFSHNVCKEVVWLNTPERDMRHFDMDVAKREDVDLIVFCDITPTAELYQELIKLKPVYIFDHHISAQSIIGEDAENYFFDVTRCGSKILFDALYDGSRMNRTLVQFVELVNTYDLFKTDSVLWDQAKDLHNAMFGYVKWSMHDSMTDTERYENFINIQIKKIDDNKGFFFTSYEVEKAQLAREKENKEYREAKKNIKFREDNLKNKYAFFSCSSKLSFVAYRLLSELKGQIDYVVGFSTYKDDNRKVSIRSLGEFDVSSIAEKWGGGGHKNASGVELTELFLEQFKEGKIHLL